MGPADLAVAWCRADCDRTVFALALCAPSVPADLAASRICSLWKIAAREPRVLQRLITRRCRIYNPTRRIPIASWSAARP